MAAMLWVFALAAAPGATAHTHAPARLGERSLQRFERELLGPRHATEHGPRAWTVHRRSGGLNRQAGIPVVSSVREATRVSSDEPFERVVFDMMRRRGWLV